MWSVRAARVGAQGERAPKARPARGRQPPGLRSRVPCTSGGSTSGSRGGSLGPGGTGGYSHCHRQTPGHRGSGAVASRPLVPEEAHHWGTQLGTPGAEEGRVGATGGPRTPQGSPVTSAETRVPSASRMQTQACAVRLPGRGKERVVSHRALCGWPVPTSPGDLLPPLGPETSQPRVSSVYDESGKDNGEMQ